MIISHGRRYIFVHAPKTGGTSLALALEQRAMKDDIMLGDTPKATRRRHRVKNVASAGRLWKHSGLADIQATGDMPGLVTSAELASFFVFTIVRNPWDRLVSYYHWLRVQSFAHPAVGIAKTQDFAGFLRQDSIANSLRKHPYASYVTDADGTERADLFLRLEQLSHDLAPLSAHLGFDLGPMPHANRSDRRADYRSYYSTNDAEIVAKTCAEDIKRFGYRFE